MMNKIGKASLWLLGLSLWAAVLAPFFLGSSAAHPATDDFTFAAYTHPTWVQTGSILHVLKDALSYALRTWRDWQGTVTGVIVMTLNPAVFSLEHYGVHAVALLALHLVSWFVFIRHILAKRMGLGRSAWIPLYLLLSAISLTFLPDIVEGVYWFNGAWFYTGAQAAALLALVLCDVFAQSRAGKGAQIALFVLCYLLLFALGMDNYITAMMTLSLLLVMTLQRAWALSKTPGKAMIGAMRWEKETVAFKDRREFGGEAEKALQKQAAVRTTLLMIPIAIGLAISVLAPGNHVRMQTDGAHQPGMDWLITTMLWTMRDAAWYILRFLVKTPLLALLIAATPYLAKATDRMEERSWRCPPVVLTLLAFYFVLCAMIAPHMYSSGYAGSGRVVNMYHFYIVLFAPIAYLMILLRVRPKRRSQLTDGLSRSRCLVYAGAALLVCALLGQHAGYEKLVRDQLDGTQDRYAAQFEMEYMLCAAAGEEDTVELPAWTVQTMTGKPTADTDETMWTNEAMAHYFGVKAVKVIK